MYRLLTTKRVLAKPRRAASKKTSTLNPPTTSTANSSTTSVTTTDAVCIDLDEEDSNKELLKGFIVNDLTIIIRIITIVFIIIIFRSTPPRRPNKASLDVCPYIRTSVQLQKVSLILKKFGRYVGVDE